MVIEFQESKVANGLLITGTATWGGQPKKTQRYNQECIITQCFKCHQYKHLSKTCKAREVCGYCSSKEHNTKDHPDPKNKGAMKCALCGGKHTAWSGACPKRKAILMKISEAKKELLMHLYFLEQVTITPGVSGRATRETSHNRRQLRKDTEEVIVVDIADETIGDNTAEEPEEPNRPSPVNTHAFNFNPSSSGIKASIYNFTA